MTDNLNDIAYTDGDVDVNVSDNPTLDSIVNARFSRRSTIASGFATAAAVFAGTGLAGCGDDEDDQGVPNAGPPAVSANAVASAASGTIIALTGTATDDGSIAAQNWTQVSGPAVTITNPNALSASFVAPSVATATPVVVRLTATDNAGLATQADRTITVNPAAMTFTAVPKSLADVVAVPAGHNVTILYSLGDPINQATPAYKNDGTDTGFSARAGDHHDGMSYFGLSATGTTPDPANSARGLLVMNHENITRLYLHANGPTTVAGARPEAEALKEIECHGVSVIEVTRSTAGAWTYVQNSTLNRRITPLTPTTFNGPVRGNALLRTRFSTAGTDGRGTINNCANGYTPWGTYLTCEENWAGYFRRDADAAVRTPKQVAGLARYGIGATAGGNNAWATVVPADATNTSFSKFNITATAGAPADGTGDFRNEVNQYGWVVEIDPYNPTSVPRKRTALGRMGHEGAWPSRFVVGVKPAWYMGDDSQGEYCYKFVSNTPWVAADANATDRLAIGDKYMDAGTLYVARFDSSGSGVWLPLVFNQGAVTAAYPAYAFADQADVLTHARHAADAVGATKMDRPEWTAINPKSGEMYLTLTNNAARGFGTTDAANPRTYIDAPGTNRGNPNGHIVRLKETGDSSEALTFTWDIYAFGAGSDLDPINVNLSGLDATNDFSSPDGLWFSRASNAGGQVNPLLWIQTDDGAFTDVTNCMMLAAMPGPVGDGGARTVTNSNGTTTATQATIVGKNPGMTLRRFLVGPKQCEITGIDSTPDGRTLFVNIQHPGENGTIAALSSNWPANQAGTAAPTARPRSATIVITRTDGGIVGL